MMQSFHRRKSVYCTNCSNCLSLLSFFLSILAVKLFNESSSLFFLFLFLRHIYDSYRHFLHTRVGLRDSLTLYSIQLGLKFTITSGLFLNSETGPLIKILPLERGRGRWIFVCELESDNLSASWWLMCCVSLTSVNWVVCRNWIGLQALHASILSEGRYNYYC